MRGREQWSKRIPAVLVLFATLALAPAALAQVWADEAKRLAEALELRPGSTIAEIGAGRGELTVEMARLIGPDGRVYSTEISAARRDDIAEAVRAARLSNVVVVEAGARDTNLLPGCCVAIYMRAVFHHFEDPAASLRSLHASLQPDGLLAIIEYPQRGRVSENCHCVPRDELVEQVTSHGFELVRTVERWSGSRYLSIFRKVSAPTGNQ